MDSIEVEKKIQESLSKGELTTERLSSFLVYVAENAYDSNEGSLFENTQHALNSLIGVRTEDYRKGEYVKHKRGEIIRIIRYDPISNTFNCQKQYFNYLTIKHNFSITDERFKELVLKVWNCKNSNEADKIKKIYDGFNSTNLYIGTPYYYSDTIHERDILFQEECESQLEFIPPKTFFEKVYKGIVKFPEK